MEAINWDAIAALSEAIGVIVVVGSLIFVGLQIRQNAQATKVATVENITSDLRAFNFQVGADSEFAETLYQGWFHPGNLEAVDLFRHNNITTGAMQIFLNMFYQRKKGTFDNELFIPYQNYLRVIAALPGVRIYWSERAGWYPHDFQQYMENEIFVQVDETIFQMYIDQEKQIES
jgi:hypothetical protein